MEEKLSDRICRDVFIEFYSNNNQNENNDNSKIYNEKSLSESKKIFELLMKNDNIETKDKYYIWMILLIIIKSLYRLGKIEESLEYILISLKYSDASWKMNEIMYYLIEYNKIVGNKCK